MRIFINSILHGSVYLLRRRSRIAGNNKINQWNSIILCIFSESSSEKFWAFKAITLNPGVAEKEGLAHQKSIHRMETIEIRTQREECQPPRHYCYSKVQNLSKFWAKWKITKGHKMNNNGKEKELDMDRNITDYLLVFLNERSEL